MQWYNCTIMCISSKPKQQEQFVPGALYTDLCTAIRIVNALLRKAETEAKAQEKTCT